MPTIEYTCQQCGHEFKRVVYLGDTPTNQPCPKCKNIEVKPDKSYSGLTGGLLSFGSLAKDTN